MGDVAEAHRLTTSTRRGLAGAYQVQDAQETACVVFMVLLQSADGDECRGDGRRRWI